MPSFHNHKKCRGTNCNSNVRTEIMKAIKLLPRLLLALIAGKLDVHAAPPPVGSQVIESTNITVYPAGWSQPKYRLDAEDAGVVMHYGNGPDHCDELGARDVWIWEYEGKYLIGLPSVIKAGERLSICYDGQSDPKDMWHMKRDVGLAWLKLPLVPPVKK